MLSSKLASLPVSEVALLLQRDMMMMMMCHCTPIPVASVLEGFKLLCFALTAFLQSETHRHML
jgi:hypothetical protein